MKTVIDVYLDNAPHLLLVGLVVFIILDYITGLLRAMYEGVGNSKTHYKGIIKKLGIVLGVLFGAVADIIMSEGMPIFTTMLAFLFIAGEALSIIENLGVMGVYVPEFIKDRFEQIRENEGRAENSPTKLDVDVVYREATDTFNGIVDRDYERKATQEENTDKGGR